MRELHGTLRQLSATDSVLYAVSRALRWLSRGRVRLEKYVFLAQPVPQDGASTARRTGIAVEEILEGDPRLAQFERPVHELGRRFAGGARCFAAFHERTLVGFLWFAERGYEEDEVRCTFRLHAADEAVWDFDVHVVPRYRLGRTFALLWERAFAALRERDVRWSLSRVSAFKPESMRAHQRLGAQPTGWAAFLLLGPMQLTLTSSGQVKCRWLEHGPYPELEVRPPSSGGDQRAADRNAREDLAPRLNSGGADGRFRA